MSSMLPALCGVCAVLEGGGLILIMFKCISSLFKNFILQLLCLESTSQKNHAFW